MIRSITAPHQLTNRHFDAIVADTGLTFIVLLVLLENSPGQFILVWESCSCVCCDRLPDRPIHYHWVLDPVCVSVSITSSILPINLSRTFLLSVGVCCESPISQLSLLSLFCFIITKRILYHMGLVSRLSFTIYASLASSSEFCMSVKDIDSWNSIEVKIR